MSQQTWGPPEDRKGQSHRVSPGAPQRTVALPTPCLPPGETRVIFLISRTIYICAVLNNYISGSLL